MGSCYRTGCYRNKIINNLVAKLNDKKTSLCVKSERIISEYFEASCSTPVGANAIIKNNDIHLTAMIGSLDGKNKIYHEENGEIKDYKKIGLDAAKGLERKGARELL